MRSLSTLATLLVGLVLASTANATLYNYVYTGNPFTSASGDYSTSDFVSGNFTVDLPSNNASLPFTDHVSDVKSFSFSDGVRTLTDADSFLQTVFIFRTDETGNISEEWQIELIVAGGDRIQTWRFFQEFLRQDLAEFGGDSAGNSLNPGTWTVSQVPAEAISTALVHGPWIENAGSLDPFDVNQDGSILV